MKSVLKHHEPPRAVERACYGLLAISVMAVAGVGARLATTNDLPSAETVEVPSGGHTLGDRIRPATASAIRVVDTDPFHPRRTAPAERYLLPEARDASTAGMPGPLREGLVQLLGTAVSGSGAGFVMCQVGNATPEMVWVGDEVADMTLRSIRRGEADFVRRDGTTVTLRVPTAEGALQREPGR